MKMNLYKKYRDFIKDYKEKDENWKYFFSGIILALLAFVIFVGVIQYYIKQKIDLKMDVWAIQYVKGIENSSLSSLFKFITNIGNPAIVIIMTLIIIIFLYKKDMRNESMFFACNMLGVGALNEILKLVFKRERPAIKIISASGYSMPSGHSMGFLAFSILCSYLVLIYVENKRKSYFISICFLLVAFIIGISRIYLRVHFLSDVLAGWSAAILWSESSIALHRYLYYKKKIRTI